MLASIRLSARRMASSTTDCGSSEPECRRLTSSGVGTRKRTAGCVGLPGREARSRRSFSAASVIETTAALPAARWRRRTAAGLSRPKASRTLTAPAGAAIGAATAAVSSGVSVATRSAATWRD